MLESNKAAWVNGQLSDLVSVFDRGLAFGDGVFETMFLHRGVIPLIDLHRSRLLASAQQLGIQIDQQQFDDDIAQVVNYAKKMSADSWRVKFILTRGDSDSGYTPPPYVQANRIVHLLPYDQGLVRLMQEQGVKTVTCHWRLSAQPGLVGMKHLNRLDQIRARQELVNTEYFEGLMRCQEGFYTDGTMSNIFAITPTGELITPALQTAGVNGVMRRMVMESLAPAIDMQCHEAEIHRMNEFSEVFITNAMIGVVPVISADNNLYSIGSVTRQLQQQLSDFLRATINQYGD